MSHKIHIVWVIAFAMFALVLSLPFCRSERMPNITVIQPLKTDLSAYSIATVDIQCADSIKRTPFILAYNYGGIASELMLTLHRYGIKTHGSEKTTILNVKCIYRNSWGIPSLGRHFNIHFRYLSFVNIQFIDQSKNTVLGEVEYSRPFCSRNGPGFAKDMLEILIGPPNPRQGHNENDGKID
jgi:hypothetical protein